MNPENNTAIWVERFLTASIFGLFLYRLANFDGALIYRHSYGEAQYAMWAKYYAEHGLVWGVYQVDHFEPFLNYLPIASFSAAAAHRWLGLDIVTVGRAVAFGASVLSAYGFFRLAQRLLVDRLTAIFATAIFVATPLNMYFSRLLYNDPLLVTIIIWFFVVFYAGALQPRARVPALAALATLMVFTKPTTLFFCGPLVLVSWWRRREGDRPLKAELLAILVPPVIGVAFIAGMRLFIATGNRVESNKVIWTLRADEVLPRVHTLALQYYAEHGLLLLVMPVAFLVCIVRGRQGGRDMCVYLGFFAVFVLVMLPGAVIHQYYSLPVLVAFPVIAAEASHWATARLERYRPLIFALAFLVLAPSAERLDAAFAPYYPVEVPHVAAVTKRLVPAPEHLLVVGATFRIFQFYLDVPWDNTVRNWRYDDVAAFLSFARERQARFLLVDKSLPGVPVDALRAAAEELLYDSPDHLLIALPQR